MQLSFLLAILAPSLLFIPVRTDCSPSCVSPMFCDGLFCKLPNDKTQSCSLDSECVDEANGGCISGLCSCKPNFAWWDRLAHCGRKVDSTVSCTQDSDCVELIGVCRRGYCACPYIYELLNNACVRDRWALAENNGATNCTTNGECMVIVRGGCIGGTCTCQSDYTWSTWAKTCTHANDGTKACTSVQECADDKYGECVSGKCKCITNFVWMPDVGRCVRLIAEAQKCTTLYDCDDSVASCYMGNCTCNTGTMWDQSKKSCMAIDLKAGQTCSYSVQCADNKHGSCQGGTCKCNAGYLWSDVSLKCIKPNNGTYNCTDVSQCADSKNGRCSMGYCICPAGNVYSTEREQCLGSNDGVSQCNSRTECCDEDNGECLQGVCVCFVGAWGSGCASLHDNDATHDCTSTLQCSDRTFGVCNKKCLCKTGFKWIKDRCAKPNDRLTACVTGAECYESSDKGGCYNGYCDCNRTWNSSTSSCLTPASNDGIYTSACETVHDCWDQINGVCDSGICKCASSYIWQYPSCKKTSLPNQPQIYQCQSSSYCQDYNVGYCILGFCNCRSDAFWSEEKQLCLVRNDGIGICKSPGDCADTINGKCDSDKNCVCNLWYTWNDRLGRCVNVTQYNNGTASCNVNEDCSDVTNGACYNGVCVCVVGKWDTYLMKCNTDLLKQNNGTAESICQNSTECSDSVNGICDGVCKCKPGYVYSSRYSRCGRANDDLQACDTIIDCVDMVNGLCTNGKCTCKPSTDVTPTGECSYLNDGSGPCSSDTECYVNSSEGLCSLTSSICLCATGYTWNPIALVCTRLLPNDETRACTSAFQCADSVYGDCVAGICVCNIGFTWSSVGYSCRKPNDNSHVCASRAECADPDLGECLWGRCSCPAGSVWVAKRQRCLLCPAGCATCYASGVCSSCIDKYFIPDGGTLCIGICSTF